MSAAEQAPTRTPTLRVSLLGHVRVEHGPEALDIGPPQRQAVLSALILAQGRPMTTTQLLGAVWGEEPSDKAATAVRAHVSVLRRALEPDRAPRAPSEVIRSVPSGYVVPPGVISLDVASFRTFVRDAEGLRREGRPVEAGQALRSGLDLWRGDQALIGVPGPAADVSRAVLEDERLSAWEEFLEIELARRAPDRPVHSGLIRALAAHPHRERLHGLLVRSYHRQGRRAEALAAYASARERLRDDLGVEPGPALRELHRRILADEPVEEPGPPPAVGAPAAGSPTSGTVTPEARVKLPDAPVTGAPPVAEEAEAAPTAFARDRAGPLPARPAPLGRDREVATTVTALADPAATVLVRGMPGLGSSTVALAAAHAVATDRPGGVVVLGAAADEEAWDAALDALVPGPCLLLADGIREPEDAARALAARERAERSLGGHDVAVLLTGTHRLPRLRLSRVELDPLDDASTRALFVRELGDDRAETESEAVTVIAAISSGFPQETVATAVNLASRPSWSLKDWLDDLMALAAAGSSAPRYGLDPFFGDHYGALGPWEAAVFRAGGLHPATPLPRTAVAAVTGLDLGAASHHLEDLQNRGLVESHKPGEYRYAYLLWNYARMVGEQDDDPDLRATWVTRLLEHYADQLDEAVAVLDQRPTERPRSELMVVFRGAADASAWVSEHRGGVEALLHEHGKHPSAVRLAAVFAVARERPGP